MPFSVFRRVCLSLTAAFALSATPAKPQEAAPLVAGASNLEFALIEVAARFEAETGESVRLTFGSTGNIARQIRQGAPYALFLAADDTTILDLHQDGMTRDEGAVYAVGRIVLAAPHESSVNPADGLEGVAAVLESGRLTRFAIANPAHAPFGIAAREALEARGLWDDLQPFLVMGENVSQAAQFALSGNADGGIIALSLALAPQVAERGTYHPIPEELHEPLRQRMALLDGAGEVAEAFYAYMQQPEARAIMERYGFVLPDG